MTPGERRQRFDEIIKDIDTASGFEDFSSHVAKILKSIPSSLTSQDLLNAKLKEYETVTDFARHHSTTRSAVPTFLVGLSFGVTGAILTKSKDLDAVAKIIGSCLAVTILSMACIFDYFFYGNLKAALDRGKALEEKINNRLKLDGDLALEEWGQALKYQFFLWRVSDQTANPRVGGSIPPPGTLKSLLFWQGQSWSCLFSCKPRSTLIP